MPIAVGAVIVTDEITQEEFLELVTKDLETLAKRYHFIGRDGKKRVASIKASVGTKEEGEEPEVNVFIRTNYLTEWEEVKRELRNTFLLGILTQFEGKENTPRLIAQLAPISDPMDVAARINQQLRRIGRARKPGFSWEIEHDRENNTLQLITNPLR
jgi:hypothetical protein